MQVLSHSVSKFDLASFDLTSFDIANIGATQAANVVNINHGTSYKPANLRTASTANPRQNHLLASLSEAELQSFEADLELVYVARNEILYESGETPSYMFFPTTAIVSLQYLTEMGSSSELAVVGNDGVVGVSLFMSGTKAINQAQVNSAGHGYRLRAQLAKKLINNSNTMLTMLLRYSQAMFTQVAQTAVCNRHHSVDQQLSRRLLLSLDRLSSNDIMMTQETIANMLGVRRESVTEAALKLQDAGAIKYSRGHITVLNRKLLEKRSCECYSMEQNQVVQSESCWGSPCNAQ